MNIKLDRSNFFSYYAFKPRDPELSAPDRRIALLGTILLGLTLGIGHLFCRLFLYDPKKIPLTANKTGKAFQSKMGDTPAQVEEMAEKPVIQPTPSTYKGLGKIEIPKEDPLQKELHFLFPYDYQQEVNPEEKKAFDEYVKLPPDQRKKREVDFSTTYLSTWREWTDVQKQWCCSSISANKEALLSGIKKRIQVRIDDLNQKVQFEKRVNQLKIESVLQMGDLEAPWEQSAIKIAFLSNDEVSALTMEEINAFSPRQIEMLKGKLRQLEPKQNALLPSDVDKLSILELRGLSQESLNKNWDKIPVFALQFLTEEQRKNADFTGISSKQFKALFPLTDYGSPAYWDDIKNLQSLKKEQLYQCWNHLQPPHIGHISKEQLRQLDFASHPLSQDQFDELFPPWVPSLVYEQSQPKSRIRDLSNAQVLQLKNFMDGWRLYTLSDDQLKEIDLETLFEGLSTEEKTKRLKGLFFVSHKEALDYEAKREKARKRKDLLNEKSKEVVMSYLGIEYFG